MLSLSMIPMWRGALNASCEKRGSLLRSNAPRRPIRQPPDSKLWIVALVAQGIEQDGPNVKVGGSIPSGGTKHIFQQRSEHAHSDGTTGGASPERDDGQRPGERS